jgi:hypothetical protein
LPDHQGSLWTCDTLQLAEDKFLPLVAEKYPNACEELKVRVAFNAGPYWEFPAGRRISGIARCWNHSIELSSKVIYESSYAHEMLHILQNCEDVLPVDPGFDSSHADWQRNGFTGIISNWKAAMKKELE